MIENKNTRAQSSPGELKRWNSDSSLSDSVFSSSRIAEANAMSENRRESTQALSEFLMTKQPPPGNWVSHPSDDEQSLKTTASKMFRRRKSKPIKRPQYLKLPDSAIAATTTSGSRYIAISIPLEGVQNEKQPEESVPARPQSQPWLPSERGPVTVLKPVVEARESSSGSSPSKSRDAKLGNRISRAESDMTPTVEILGPEATRTLENYYTQLSRQQKRDATTHTSIAPSRSQRSYVAVLPVDNISRQETRRTNITYSARTVDSTASMSSPMSPPRRASTAPSATAVPVSRKLNLPPRNSSLNKIATAVQVELLHIGRPENDSPREDTQRSSILSIDGSMLSGTTATQSPTTAFCAAETAQSGISPTMESHLQNVTPLPKPPSPPPNKKLPDIPKTQVNSLSRQSTSHPVQIKTVAPPSPARKPTISVDPEECVQASQSRQDRVKARKLRDMAILRDTSNSARLPAEDGAKGNRVPSQNSSHLTAPPARNPRRVSSSHRKKIPMTLSPVMFIASTEPASPDLLPPSARRSARNSLNASKSLNIPPHKLYSSKTPRTPPHSRSITPTFGSDSETIPTRRKQVHHRASDLSLNSSFLDSYRQERRARRNVSLKEKEIDARLKKVERDNMALMNTLSGIAMSFQELNMNRLHPKTGGKKMRAGGLLEGARGGGEDSGDSGDEAGIEA